MKYQTKIKMNQNTDTNQGGGQSGQANGSAAPQGTQTSQAAGGGATPPTDQSAQQTPPPDDLGYGAAEPVAVGAYGAEGVKEPAAKPQDEIKLGYELEGTEGFTDDEVLAVKQFAAKNKLSKEAAKDFIESKKADALKFNQHIENQKAEYAGKVKAYKASEHAKLVKEIGGEGGKEFKANLKKISDFLDQNIPELKKEIDQNGVFLSASVMKGIFNLQAKLLKEEPLVNGGGKSASTPQTPWERRYK